MRRAAALVSIALGTAGALAPLPGRAEPGAARVIVSSTVNDTLHFFDAASLAEIQPPLPSRGGAPVRLWVDRIDGTPFLFAANHGVEGSLGVFDLSGDLTVELPLSPFPARPGSVGVTAGHLEWQTPPGGPVPPDRPFVFVTNTWQALGGCGLPAGSVTAYDARQLATLGVLTEIGTAETSGSLPYAVAFRGREALAFASSSCSGTLDTFRIQNAPCPAGLCPTFTRVATREAAPGSDGVVFDQGRDRAYVANIDASSLSVFDASSPRALTTIPLPGARPIEATPADTPGGRALVITANDGDDSISLIDRDRIETCIAGAAPACPQAEVARIPTAVPGGAPEGVAYDPGTNRVFVVNKSFPPSLSVIRLIEEPDGTLRGAGAGTIPLGALGTPVPALIAFDVVVQQR